MPLLAQPVTILGVKFITPEITELRATEAPKTFRMPISLRRWAELSAASPNSPMQDIKMAMTMAVFMIWLVFR